MEELVINVLGTAATVSGLAAWIAAFIQPRYLPFVSGIVQLVAGNFGHARNS